MKKLSLYIFLFLMWCNVGFAEYGDVYYCNTTQISELKKMEVNSNFDVITFKMSMEKSDDTGFVKFSDEAVGKIVNDPIGFGLIIDTHVEPEQFMAGFGMTKAWFYKGQLSTSSVYHGDDSVVDRIVTSISQCDKF